MPRPRYRGSTAIFDNSMIHRDQGHASNRFRLCVCHKNLTAFGEDCRPRIAECLNVFRLKNEMSADPLFVQGPKCRCTLTGKKGEDRDLRAK